MRGIVVVGDEEERGSRQSPGLQVKTLVLLLDSIKLWGIGCYRTDKRQGEMPKNTPNNRDG